MKGIILQLLFLLFTNTKIGVESAPSENLQLSIRAESQSNFALNKPFKIQCHLKRLSTKDSQDMLKSGSLGSVFFYCPYSPDGTQFCLQNCINICEGLDACRNKRKLEGISCSKTIDAADGSVLYEYSIPKYTQEWSTQDSFCKHRNIISEKIIMDQFKQTEDLSIPKETSKTMEVLDATKLNLSIDESEDDTTMKKLVIPDIEKIEAQLPNEGFPEVKSYQRKNFSTTILKLPMEIIVIIFITCLCLSILLNVFCFLRCVLIKHYSKNLNSPSMQEFFCMKKEIFLARHFKKTTNGIMDSYVTKHYPMLTIPANNSNTSASITSNQPNNFIYTCQKDLQSVPEYGLGPVVFYQDPIQCCSPKSENSNSNGSNICHRHLSDSYHQQQQPCMHPKLSDSGISMNHQNNLKFVQEVSNPDNNDTYIACKSFHEDGRSSKIFLVPKSIDYSLSRTTLRPDDAVTIQSDPMNRINHQFPASIEYSGIINQNSDNQPMLFLQGEDDNNNVTSNCQMKTSNYLYNESLQRKNKPSSLLRGDIQSETLERKSLILQTQVSHRHTPISFPQDDLISGKNSVLYFYSGQNDQARVSCDLNKNISENIQVNETAK